MKKILFILLGGFIALNGSWTSLCLAHENESNYDLSDNDLSDNDLADNDLADNDLADNDLADNDLADNDLADNDVADYDLSGYDLSGYDLADYDLSGYDLADYDLSDYEVSVDTKMSDGEERITEFDDRTWSKYMNIYCRSKLNDAEKELWDDLYDMCITYITTTRNARINVGEKIYFLEPVSCHGLAKERAEEIVDMFLYQAPQFYFLDKYRRCTEVAENDYVISMSIYKDFIEGDIRKESTRQFYNKIDEWVLELSTDENDYELARSVHDKVCNEVIFKGNEMTESVWCAVMLGETVCAGYSKLYTMLANAVGIETIGMTSWSLRYKVDIPLGVIPKPHAWNKSYVDGNWYVVDATWDDDPDGVGTVSYECFLVDDDFEKFKRDTAHDLDEFYKDIAPKSPNVYNVDNEPSGDIPPAISDMPIKTDGIFVAELSKNGIFAGVVASFIEKNKLEYRWYVSQTGGTDEVLVSDWTMGNEWLSWKPEKSGNYNLKCQIRYNGMDSTIKECEKSVEYKKEIKGICQIPYENGEYLIGVETFENPNQDYKYQLLILDCTLLAKGEDAWIYGTAQSKVAEGNALWTLWKPQYGYYWTLFRVFDENDQLIDELCYGFVNAY